MSRSLLLPPSVLFGIAVPLTHIYIMIIIKARIISNYFWQAKPTNNVHAPWCTKTSLKPAPLLQSKEKDGAFRPIIKRERNTLLPQASS
jgi:hypothetical protein